MGQIRTTGIAMVHRSAKAPPKFLCMIMFCAMYNSKRRDFKDSSYVYIMSLVEGVVSDNYSCFFLLMCNYGKHDTRYVFYSWKYSNMSNTSATVTPLR